MKYYHFNVEISFITEKNTNEVLSFCIRATGYETAKYVAHSQIRIYNSDPRRDKIRQPEITAVELVPSI